MLAKHADGVTGMTFMDAGPRKVMGFDCFVSRSGYTGEDGFEISVPAKDAEALAGALLDDPAVLPIGLGARDSLRLEAGLCLYGHDIDTGTTPVEANLNWSIQKSRRSGGARAGGFPGADIILKQFDTGAPRKRVGIKAGRPRAGARACAALCRRDRRASRSARSRPAASGRASTVRWRWAMCRRRMRPTGRSYSPKCAASASPSASPPFPSHPMATSAEDFWMTVLYTADHEWLRIEGDVATVGVTDYAQTQLGDVVFVDLPKVGRVVKKAEATAVVESVKAASDVYAPI